MQLFRHFDCYSPTRKYTFYRVLLSFVLSSSMLKHIELCSFSAGMTATCLQSPQAFPPHLPQVVPCVLLVFRKVRLCILSNTLLFQFVLAHSSYRWTAPTKGAYLLLHYGFTSVRIRPHFPYGLYGHSTAFSCKLWLQATLQTLQCARASLSPLSLCHTVPCKQVSAPAMTHTPCSGIALLIFQVSEIPLHRHGAILGMTFDGMESTV